MLRDSGVESSAVAVSGGEDVRLEDSGERVAGGKRWPRPETLALLRIRSEMDSAFRDSTLKAPLWEDISRKMSELGYRRSAKKCKEKFENVYKYHKRTKEGRSCKPEGKLYRFFDELEAFQSLHSYPPDPESRPPKLPVTTTSTTTTTTTGSLVPRIGNNINPSTGTSTSPLRLDGPNPSSGTNPTFSAKQQPATPFVANRGIHSTLGVGYKTNCNSFTSSVMPLNLFSSSTSSSTASEEEEEEEKMSRKRRRYWKRLLKKLTKGLMEKQEEMQKRFFETLEKREEERTAREEALRVQETARINGEYEILAHERSVALAKDASIVSFLHKVSGQHPQQQQQQQCRGDLTIAFLNDQNHGSNYLLSPSSSRWPKAEVEALIRLRTNVGTNYQENGTKGLLWEEISAGMRRLGHNRSAKRCKEKWENINKYFKKVKESNKKRPVDSKTCPYFHQLDAIYKEKMNKTEEASLPLTVVPQQQWLPPQETRDESKRHETGNEERDSEEEEEDEEDDKEDGEGDNETGWVRDCVEQNMLTHGH